MNKKKKNTSQYTRLTVTNTEFGVKNIFRKQRLFFKTI